MNVFNIFKKHFKNFGNYTLHWFSSTRTKEEITNLPPIGALISLESQYIIGRERVLSVSLRSNVCQ